MWKSKKQRDRRNSYVDSMHLIFKGRSSIPRKVTDYIVSCGDVFLCSLTREFVYAWSLSCRSSISFSRAAQGNTDLCKYLAQALCFITSRPAKTSLALYPTHRTGLTVRKFSIIFPSSTASIPCLVLFSLPCPAGSHHFSPSPVCEDSNL